jgi:hypothetical protein
LTAAESSPRWWPFGKKGEANAADPAAAGVTSVPQQTNLPPVPNTSAGTTTSAPATSANPLAVVPPAANAPIVPPGTAAPTNPTITPLAKETAPPVTPETEKKERWMLSSPKGKVSWPHLNKDLSKGGPLFSTKKKEEDPTRNSWVEKTPTPPKQSPMKPVTDGAKSAWRKTKDALTPGEQNPQPQVTSPRIAKREVKPPFWKRMFGAKSELQQPQTVPEWMAQQRLDP